MPGAIGVNLRVTGHSSQGGRKYMEDFFSVAYQQSEDECDLEFAFFGIFDGHGGAEAAAYAKEHLMRQIVSQKHLFWSDKDEDVLRAIREGYIATHKAMWREQEKWPRTATGLPSTAGTTATVAFIRRGKLFIGHVGDSGIVLGYEDPVGAVSWRAKPLTQDHKPECDIEKSRIMSSGGKVVAKSGVSRVVWTRPRLGHKGPIRRSTPIDEIPFLAVARSLGDLWSYNSQHNEFVVSPEPDVLVIPIEKNFRCLVFGTDGLWNVMSPNTAVDIVRNAEFTNDRNYYCSKELLNPSRSLVNRALEKWSTTRVRADNTSVVTILLDPPGGPKRKQFSANPLNHCNNRQQVMQQQVMHHNNNQQVVGGQQQPQMAHFDNNWHTMEEECLNGQMRGVTSGSAPPPPQPMMMTTRTVEEELDLLNESLYNQHHQQQYNTSSSNHMDMAGGGGDFNLLASPTTSTHHHLNHYENYMNLTHQYNPSRQPPPGGFLQSHLQGTSQMLQSMALQFESDVLAAGDYDHSNAIIMEPGASEESAPIVMEHPVGYNSIIDNNERSSTLLPTFSHLLEDTHAASTSSYSLTRLETRMEQLTNSAALYANYQQLIESTSSYSPQVDVDAINNFHDYAGVPLISQGGSQEENSMLPGVPVSTVQSSYESPLLPMDTDNHHQQQQMGYAMDHEKFAWSQEWHQEQPQGFIPTNNNNNSVEVNAATTCEGVIGQDDDTDSDTDTDTDGDEEGPSITVGSSEVDAYPTPLSPTIQIHEISSSGVVPTPPPTANLVPAFESEETKTSLQLSKVVEKKNETIAAIKKPSIENLRRRPLRCQVTSSSSSPGSPSMVTEKENKSSSEQLLLSSPPPAKCRRLQTVPTLTLAVKTRSTAATTTTCVATRKSTAAAALLKSATVRLRNNNGSPAIKTSLRSKQAVSVKNNNSPAKRNLLLNSSKFNQQQPAAKDVIKAVVKPEVMASSSGIGRRFSKRDKVRNTNKTVAVVPASAAVAWVDGGRSVTSSNSTVQTRNRVQKR